MKTINLAEVQDNIEVKTLIQKADDNLGTLGYTEHGFRHCRLTGKAARRVIDELGGDSREAELAGIAGFMHDIGNVMGRREHDVAGAIMALKILQEMGMPLDEAADVAAAIGNHDEEEGRVVNRITAALILADKSDVHRSRVRNRDISTFDIHDRVNYAVEESRLNIDPDHKTITLFLRIDTSMSQVMEYFEIFLSRMVMCRRAASFLGARFALIINEVDLL
ncbi:MAG: HD domain-containing protein [Bacillota bacterium]|nr:HD domain-containing protein [Bacillota bacterium]MDW7728578.1 HD domain-containing protein [Bacillota bacterium]